MRGSVQRELIVGDDAKKGIDPRAIDRVFDRFYTGDTGERLRTRAGDRARARAAAWAARSRSSPGAGFTAFTLEPAARPSAANARETPAGATA